MKANSFSPPDQAQGHVQMLFEDLQGDYKPCGQLVPLLHLSQPLQKVVCKVLKTLAKESFYEQYCGTNTSGIFLFLLVLQ